jgi:hypothetical protein
MSPLKITKHSDPGHGWYAVKRSLIQELGLTESISSCSYQRGQTVYLEEDSDASKFFKALAIQRLGVDPSSDSWKSWQEMKQNLFKQESSYSDKKSPIRSYASYNPNRVEDFSAGMAITLYGKPYTVSHVLFDRVYVTDPTNKTYQLSRTQKDECLKA